VLSDDQADEVRQERARGVSRTELAARFGVSMATIARITSGRTYATASRSTDATIDPETAAALPSPAEVETDRRPA
jgi:transcriptional regulator with XRE-family HTH domain